MDKTKLFGLRDARQLSWSYNPNGKTKEEQREKGDSVKATLYSVPQHNQLMGKVILKPHAQHGKVTAENSCYYYVLSGSLEFWIYDEKGERQKVVLVGDDELIEIAEGTIFDYKALSYHTEVMLFRNYA